MKSMRKWRQLKIRKPRKHDEARDGGQYRKQTQQEGAAQGLEQKEKEEQL